MSVHFCFEPDGASRITISSSTYLEHGLQNIPSITALPVFRHLMQAVCLRLGRLLNQTELGRDVGLPQPTV